MHCVMLLVVLSLQAQKPTWNQFLKAVRTVETNNSINPQDGDNGDSIGPYQIQYAYWKDSRTPGKYEACRGKEYSETVMKNYFKRYCPIALKEMQCTTLARIHNGGPDGCNNLSTIKYWNKVKNILYPVKEKPKVVYVERPVYYPYYMPNQQVDVYIRRR